MTNFMGPKVEISFLCLAQAYGSEGLLKCKDDKAGGSALQLPETELASDWYSNNSATRQALRNSTAKEHTDLSGPVNSMALSQTIHPLLHCSC